MNKLFTLFAAGSLALVPASVCAKSLSPAQALRAAKGELSSCGNVSQAKLPVADNLKASPALSIAEDGMNTVYVFGDQNGFVVTAADDAMPRILLGYGDSGFDALNMPPQMQWWLDMMSQQVQYAATHPESAAKAKAASSAKEAREAVSPIVKTKWNQDAPYNDLCPVLTSSSGTQQRSVTGCVATAMSQAIKVFNWPAQGKGQNSYTFKYEGQSYTESFDFANTSFDWSEMTDTYDNASTDAANQAVATLMKACGVSVNMSYGLAATGGSGAASAYVAPALVNYFNFDEGAHFLQRQYYTAADWNETVYKELAAGRPVLYGGESQEGGHEFVCDGYSSDDYFHINWGWGGMSDGYYLLALLDPESQGIGGSDSGFTMDQDIVAGIAIPGTPGALGHKVPLMWLQGNFTPEQTTYIRGAQSEVVFGGSQSTAFVNGCNNTENITLGLKLTSAGGETQYVESMVSGEVPSFSGWHELALYASSFPVGSYTVTPAFKIGDDWHDVKTALGCAGSVEASVSEYEVSFTQTQTQPSLQVTSVKENTPIYAGEYAEFTVAVQASGDYYGTVVPILATGDTEAAQGTPKGISLNAGETQTIDWVTKFSVESGTLQAGQYTLVFVDESTGESVSEGYIVNVNGEQAVTPQVTVDSVQFADASGEGTEQSPYLINPEKVVCSVQFTGDQGYWADDVIGVVFNPSTGESVSEFGQDFVGISEGENATVTLKGAVDGLDPSTVYIFSPYGKTKGQISQSYVYVQAAASGISSLQTGDTGNAVYYTLQGVRCDNPAPGQFYIRKADGRASKVIFR